jgi:hypothetical protein
LFAYFSFFFLGFGFGSCRFNKNFVISPELMGRFGAL